MQVVDAHRFYAACPELAQRVQTCRLPGLYLWEYLCYTISSRDVVSSTAYFHEPEWMDDCHSKSQRFCILEYLRAMGCSCDEVLCPDGELIRIDPSFKSSDNGSILRLEMLFNSCDVDRQMQYMRSALKWVCGSENGDRIRSHLPGMPPYHSAVAFDLAVRVPRVLRLYFRVPQESGKEFLGVTVAASGDIISRRVYWRPSRKELTSFNVPIPCGFSPAYLADEETSVGKARKIYLFNNLWKKKGA